MNTLKQILSDYGLDRRNNTASNDWVHVQDKGGKTLLRIPVGKFPIGVPVIDVGGLHWTVVSVYYDLNSHLRYVCENSNGVTVVTGEDQIQEIT